MIKSSTKSLRKQPTRGVHTADGKKSVCRYGQIIGKSLWKNLIQWVIFIHLVLLFSASVTKLYPKQNRGVFRTTTKFKMELFAAKVNDIQSLTFVTKNSILDFEVVLDTPLRKDLFPFLLSKANGYLKI